MKLADAINEVQMARDGLNRAADLIGGLERAFLAAKEDRENLAHALSNFLENPDFVVSVGGNPNRVLAMIANARAALEKATLLPQ